MEERQQLAGKAQVAIGCGGRAECLEPLSRPWGHLGKLLAARPAHGTPVGHRVQWLPRCGQGCQWRLLLGFWELRSSSPTAQRLAPSVVGGTLRGLGHAASSSCWANRGAATDTCLKPSGRCIPRDHPKEKQRAVHARHPWHLALGTGDKAGTGHWHTKIIAGKVGKYQKVCNVTKQGQPVNRCHCMPIACDLSHRQVWPRDLDGGTS